MKKCIIIFACFIVLNPIHSQNSKKNPVSLSNIQFIVKNGLVMGSSFVPYYQGQVSVGIEKGNWFYGFASGVDYHNLKRSFPVTVEVQRYFDAKGLRLFTFGNAGYNFSSVTDNHRTMFASEYVQKGGLYYEAGAGLRMGKKGKLNWGPSVSYSCKQSRERGYEFAHTFGIVPTTAKGDFTDYKYSFRRYILRINFWF